MPVTSEILESEIKWHARNNLLQRLLKLDDSDVHTFSYHEQWWHSQWSYWVQESIEFVAGWHLYSLKWTRSLQGGPFGQSPIVGPQISVSLWAWESKVKRLCKSRLCKSDQRLTLFTPQLLLPSFHSQALYYSMFTFCKIPETEWKAHWYTIIHESLAHVPNPKITN